MFDIFDMFNMFNSVEEANLSNKFFDEDFSDWLDAVDLFVREGKADCLDLSDLGLKSEHVKQVLKLLRNSRVSKLILKRNRLAGMKDLCELIKKTKIKKLDVSFCDFYCCDFSALVEILHQTKIMDFEAKRCVEWHLGCHHGSRMISHLHEPHLTSLKLIDVNLIDAVSFLSFAERLPESAITCLDFSLCKIGYDALTALFFKLPHCSIKDLNLRSTLVDLYGLKEDLIKTLSLNLRRSKLKKLDLSGNYIIDENLNILAQGLVNSSITVLDLSNNSIFGLNSFGQCLNQTYIRTLDLNFNKIEHPQMFNFPKFLKNSYIESLALKEDNLSINFGIDLLKSLKSTRLSKLDFEGNRMDLRSFTEMACVLKDTSLENIIFSGGALSSESLNILGDHLKESKLKSIDITGFIRAEPRSCLRFLERIKNSSISSIKMSNYDLFLSDRELYAQTFMNATFTHFDVCYSKIGDFSINVAPCLKFTAITHLYLSFCRIRDEHMLILAEHLKGTRIVHLNLHANRITNKGAKALAVACNKTSLLNLDLSWNKIDDDGIKILVEYLAGSFITTLNIRDNPGTRILLVEKMLYENRVISQNFINFFKRIVPENCQGNFCFHHGIHNNVADIFDEYFHFYKSVIEKPSAVSVLLEDKSIQFSREELVTLLFETFPWQLTEFICSRLEADITQHIKLLEKVEGLGLARIVELLLLNRPLYFIDEAKCILHPYVYKLLLKYKQPVCSIAVEPLGIEKIIEYFGEHSDMEGAIDVIILLTGAKTV